MKQLLREPLLHFLLLGGLVFALFSSFEEAPVTASGDVIEVTGETVDSIVSAFERTWKRAPTDSERMFLVEHHIEEEILVREALLLGPDRDDTVIRQRLALKMRFLLEAGAVDAEPDRETLQNHLEANADYFQYAPRVSFDQVALSGLSDDQSAVLEQLRGGADPALFGAGSMLPTQLHSAPLHSVDAVFGHGFFPDISGMEIGAWMGPVQSGYGEHFVRVTAYQPAQLPALEEIENEVLRHWKSARAVEIKNLRMESLRTRYVIRTATLQGDGG
ncbi:MAG: peptidylprolyl isomerase [Roseobacter sp.]|jgi:hypothetical protein|nr:peptidylprolyl isomerase [Roseobacter sp.]